MACSLHEATVPTFLQILRAMSGLVDRSEAWGADHGIGEAELLDWRLADDMWPLARQFKLVTVHSALAVESALEGVFPHDLSAPPTTFAGHREAIAGAILRLESIDPVALDARADAPMRLAVGELVVSFTVGGFLLSFAQPNFHFHAVTAYAILRAGGVPLGKLDYVGQLRTLMPMQVPA